MTILHRLFFVLILFFECLSVQGQIPIDYDSISPILAQASTAPRGINSKLSPDGNYVLSLGGLDGKYNIDLFDISSGKLIQTFRGHSSTIQGVTFDSKGKYLMSSATDETLKVWDVKSGKLLHDHKEEGCLATKFGFNPKGGEYAVTWTNLEGGLMWNEVRSEVRNLQTGKVRYVIPSERQFQFLDYFRRQWYFSNPYSADGTLLHSVNYQSTDSSGYQAYVNIIDVVSGKIVNRLEDESQVLFANNHPTENHILTAHSDSTLSIWNLEKGNRILEMKHGALILFAAFNYNGKYIFTLDHEGSTKTWNAKSGKLVAEIQNSNIGRGFKACKVNNDLVIENDDYSASIWDGSTGEFKFTLNSKIRLHDPSFTPDGEKIFTISTPSKLWDAKTGELFHEFRPKTNRLYDFEVNPSNGEILVFSYDHYKEANNIKILSGDLKKTIHAFPGEHKLHDYDMRKNIVLTSNEQGVIRSWKWGGRDQVLEIHPQRDSTYNNEWIMLEYGLDAKDVVGIDSKGLVHKWNHETGALTIQYDLPTKEGVDINASFNDDKTQVLTILDDTIRVYNLIENTLATEFSVPVDTGLFAKPNHKKAVFSPDSKRVLCYSRNNNSAFVYNAFTGAYVFELKGHTDGIYSLEFIRNGTQILTRSKDKSLKIWDGQNGSLIHDLSGHKSYVHTSIYHPEKDQIASNSWDETIKIWDVGSGHLLKTLSGATRGTIAKIKFHPNGQLLYAIQNNGRVGFWDLGSGEKLLDYFSFTGSNHAVANPAGLFDATPEALNWMYYIIGDEVIEIEQLKNRFFEPGLFQKLVAAEQLRDVEAFERVAMFPAVRSSIKDHKLFIHLTKRNGGIGKVSLFVNKKEVVPDVNPQRDTMLTIDLKQFGKYYVKDTFNTVSFRAYNEEAWLKSGAVKHSYIPYSVSTKGELDGEANVSAYAHDPHLYAIVVGTSDYAGDQLDLKFADKDSKDIASAIEQSASMLFGKDKTELHWFSSKGIENSMVGTKVQIKAAIDTIAMKAKPEDVILFYFSGHGVTHGTSFEDEQFYYLTKDLRSGDLTDPGIRSSYAISSDEMTEWINNIAAQKQIMILDACSSGKVVEDLLAVRNIPTSQIRALDRMKDRTGMFVIAGSAADKVSYEASQFGQGLLTYSLLLGMSGAALKDGQSVDVMTLFQFARDQVPEFANDIGGVQTPTLAFPTDASSFDIGIVNDEVKIPLQKIKPLFTRSNFQEEDSFRDVIRLSKSLDLYLVDASSGPTSRGIIFVDVDEYENGYSVNGRYKLDGDTVTLEGRVFRGTEKLGQFMVKGDKNDTDQFVADILNQVVRVIN